MPAKDSPRKAVSPRSFARTQETRNQFDAPSRAPALGVRAINLPALPNDRPKSLRHNRQCHSPKPPTADHGQSNLALGHLAPFLFNGLGRHFPYLKVLEDESGRNTANSNKLCLPRVKDAGGAVPGTFSSLGRNAWPTFRSNRHHDSIPARMPDSSRGSKAVGQSQGSLVDKPHCIPE